MYLCRVPVFGEDVLTFEVSPGPRRRDGGEFGSWIRLRDAREDLSRYGDHHTAQSTTSGLQTVLLDNSAGAIKKEEAQLAPRP